MWKSFTCLLKRACAEATSKMINPQALSRILSVLGHNLINSLRQVISETDSIPQSQLLCCRRWKARCSRSAALARSGLLLVKISSLLLLCQAACLSGSAQLECRGKTSVGPLSLAQMISSLLGCKCVSDFTCLLSETPDNVV